MTDASPACPACGFPMRARASRFGSFYGCTQFPKCKEKIDSKDAAKLADAYRRAGVGADVASSPAPSNPLATHTPQPLADAIAYQQEVKVAGKRMKSQFGGMCACGQQFAQGDTIVFREGKVRGCPRCGLGVQLELARLDSLQKLPGRVRDELAKLTDEQRVVARDYSSGYARVIAAAGSGKTATVATLIAHLITKGIEPKRILAMTFTRDGANEITARLSRLFGPALADVATGTLHSFSGRWLDDYYKQTLQGTEAVRIRNVLDGAGKVERGRFDESLQRQLPRDPEQLAVQLLGEVEIPWLKLKTPLGVSKKPSYYQAKDYLRAVGWLCSNIVAPGSPDVEQVEAQFDLTKLGQFYGLYFLALRDLGVSVFDEWVYLAGKHARDDVGFSQRVASQYDFVVVDECFPGDTPVLLADGTSMNIGDIVDGKLTPEVLTYNESTGKQETRRVLGGKKTLLQGKTVRVLVHRPVVSVDQRGNRKSYKQKLYVVCTEDHKIWCNGAWVAAKDLPVGGTVQIETRAIPPGKSGAYRNKYKFSPKGKAALAASLAMRQATMPHGVGNVAGPGVNRRGNGQGLTVPQQALMAELGDCWIPEFAVATEIPRGQGYPTAYKIDLANPFHKVAVELDGETHHAPTARAADAKKQAFLESKGWRVLRYGNVDAVRRAKEIAESLPADCPVDAFVVRVEDYPIPDYYVYDLSVEETHCYYANGFLVHNCQDNCAAQLILAHKVASAGKSNLLLIGDCRQAIFTWRGALPEFLTHAERYTEREVRTLHLTSNFRSKAPIVELGNALAADADWNVGPPAVAARQDANCPAAQALTVWDTCDTVDEGERVAAVAKRVMESLPAENPHPRPLAVLSRTNGGLGPTEAALLRQQIPYVISGDSGFFNRWEVRAALAHMSLACGVVSTETMKLATQAPSRALGTGFAKFVLERLSMNETEIAASGKTPIRNGAAVVFAMRQVMQRQSRYAQGRQFASDLEAIINEPGVASQAQRACAYVRDHLKAKKASDAANVDDDRLENLRVLSEIAVRFDSLDELVRYGAIGAEAKSTSVDAAITLSTCHSAKGREWPGVIIVSAFHGHFPHEKATDPNGEERRIEYVAVTRARDRLIISTPIYNNRRQVTRMAWCARLARRALGLEEKPDARAVDEAKSRMEARKAIAFDARTVTSKSGP